MFPMLKAKGKVWQATGGNKHTHVIYIPADIVKDSAYPFKLKDDVSIELDPLNKRLIITKREKAKKRLGNKW